MTVQPSGSIDAATPSSWRPVEVLQVNGERGGREEILIDANRRHGDAGERERRVPGNLDAGVSGAARHDRRAGLVEQRDFAKLAKLQDVVFENLVLLDEGQAGVLQIGG